MNTEPVSRNNSPGVFFNSIIPNSFIFRSLPIIHLSYLDDSFEMEIVNSALDDDYETSTLSPVDNEEDSDTSTPINQLHTESLKISTKSFSRPTFKSLLLLIQNDDDYN